MVKRPAAISTGYTVKRFLDKSAIAQICMQSHHHTLTGSKSAAANTFPETSSVSMASPVEKEKA